MEAQSDRAHYQVTMTAATEDEATRLGRMVVERRLAACAQVSGPITSTYRWAGEITSASEWVCTMKTTSDRLDPLFAALRDAHSYEVPEIIAVPIAAGDPDYLAWVEDGSRATGR
jgi:periplasmic divalent cation tolerance protein